MNAYIINIESNTIINLYGFINNSPNPGNSEKNCICNIFKGLKISVIKNSLVLYMFSLVKKELLKYSKLLAVKIGNKDIFKQLITIDSKNAKSNEGINFNFLVIFPKLKFLRIKDKKASPK